MTQKTLKTLRLRAQLTLDQTCELTGITRSTLWRLEKGHTQEPRLRTAEALAKAYGVKLAIILNAAKASVLAANTP